MNKMQEAARKLHALGFKTLPIKPGTKEPATKHGVKDATDDNATTDAYYALNPKHGIGVSGDGFVIFDFDVKEGLDGRDALIGWDLPDTLCQTTPSGGYHMIYRCADEIRPSVNPNIAVDVRGWHSYIVCDPTPGYCFEDDCEIADADSTVMAFLEHVRPSSTRRDKGTRGLGRPKHAETVVEGGRNDYLFRRGRSLRSDEDMSDDEIRAYLHGLNKVNCKPPLPDAEVDKLADSVLSVAPGYSEEVKAQAKKTANHVTVARIMLDKYSACYLDGAPAIFDGLSYRVGWGEVERAILREWPNSKDRDRKEVVKYLDLIMPRETQSPPNYIGFKNGVLDIETMELLSFSPEFRIPNVIPHDWNPKAQSDVLDGMFRRVACNDPFIESNLCEFLGLCMYRSGKYAFAAVLLGQQSKTASNGKSTYIDMIRNVLGEQNYSSLSLRSLGDRFNQQYLSGKLANLGDDISSEFTDGSSLEVFKKAVSGSKISTDVKNSKGYEFTPYCTMVFSANRFPKMEKLDDGTLRRLFPIRFNAYFTKEDPDFDPDIGEKLKSEDCIEAAIVRGIWGLRRVIEHRGPTDNDESKRMLKDIETDNSSILQWIEDEFVSRSWLFERETKDAYQTYAKWCSESGVRKPYGKNQFSADICSKFGFKVKVTRRETRQVRIFADA